MCINATLDTNFRDLFLILSRTSCERFSFERDPVLALCFFFIRTARFEISLGRVVNHSCPGNRDRRSTTMRVYSRFWRFRRDVRSHRQRAREFLFANFRNPTCKLDSSRDPRDPRRKKKEKERERDGWMDRETAFRRSFTFYWRSKAGKRNFVAAVFVERLSLGGPAGRPPA